MIYEHEAIYALYPNVIKIANDVAYDVNDIVVQYDAAAIAAKVIELQAAESAKEKAQATAKVSALAKLTALGLSEDEVKALVG